MLASAGISGDEMHLLHSYACFQHHNFTRDDSEEASTAFAVSCRAGMM